MATGRDTDGNGIVGGSLYTGAAPEPASRYKNHQRIEGSQHDPSKMKTIDFKQDYVVMIRKKKYYAISQQSDDLYTQVYQVNNFLNISTSHNVGGRPGQCKISIKGGERVILSDTTKASSNGYTNWDQLKSAWNDQINTPDQLNQQESKYYWRYAEKADWQPMDEIYVFSKSRYAKGMGNDSTKYKFVQIFFGYITRVTKAYQQASGGLMISIDADDHLKLLTYSRMSNRPPLDMATGGVGVRYDGVGNMIIEDNPDELTNTFQNAFAGAYPHEIIRANALAAGIPSKYINKRVEPILRIPFVPQVNEQGAELFRGDSDTRLNYCLNAAQKLNLEFFADEEGNIVLKIPSYAVGINRMNANFEGDRLSQVWADFNKPQYKTVKEAITETRTVTVGGGGTEQWYTIVKGDTLWDISKKFLGDATRWREIWNLNTSRLRSGNPNLIYPGERILIKQGGGSSEQWHTIVKGDTLWDISKKYLGNATRWREIWNLNTTRLRSGNPNLIYPGERILIKQGTPVQTKTETVVVGYKETQIKIDPMDVLRAGQGNLSKNDKFIRVINEEEMLSFTMVDSDEGIYTAATITAEPAYLKATVDGVPPGYTAAVQDVELIRQFGYRMANVAGGNSTPIVSDQAGAAIYAGLILLRSISQRFSGSLTMIEDPTIRVGDPIRFFSIDEHPFSELADRSDPAQTVYYVEAVDRQISPGQVSTMTLQLRAGRNYLQPSIYDQCTELYRYYYEETAMDVDQKPKQQESPKKVVEQKKQEVAYKTHTVVKGDTLWDISRKYYGDPRQWPKIWEANRRDKNLGPISNPNRIYPGQKIKIPPK